MKSQRPVCGSKKIDELLTKFRTLAELYLSLSDQERRTIFDSIPAKTGAKLVGLSSLCAERAMNTGDREWVKVGITAHIMEGIRADYRENIRNFVLVDYAAKSIGVDLCSMCTTLMPVADEKAGVFLTGFCERDPSMNEIDRFGMKVIRVDDQEKFIYEEKTWTEAT